MKTKEGNSEYMSSSSKPADSADTPNTKKPKGFKDLNIRVRTGAIYVALSVVCLLLNEWTTLLLICTTAGICAGEFYYILRSDAKLPNEIIGIVGAVCYPLAAFFLGIYGLALVSILLVFALTIWYVYWMRARISDVGVSLFGAMYTGMFLSSYIFIRDAFPDPWGGIVVLIVFGGIWANDAVAYFIGCRFGRHKLAPRTSPNKSWEGFLAGLVAAVLVWCLATCIPGVDIPLAQAAVIGLICALASVLGDLCESRIKRGVGVKDSGSLMPGHGGLFDRCDSQITAGVVVVFLFIAFGIIPIAL